MTDKPTTAAGYGGGQTELVRATCLCAATKLGDIMDELVVVGGLVPSLLVEQEDLPAGADSHVGTMDLDYVVRNYGAGVDDVASRLKPLLDDSSAGEAVRILNEDFREHDGVGPRRVAEFLMGTPDDEIQADVVGFVRQLLDRCV